MSHRDGLGGEELLTRALNTEPAAYGRLQLVRMKRVYEPAGPDDGYRVLVERLWPRGVSKERAQLDAWEKGISASNDLRRWYDHDPEKWNEFQRRYELELQSADAQTVLDDLTERARNGTVTLVYASKASEISCSAVVQRLLTERLAR